MVDKLPLPPTPQPINGQPSGLRRTNKRTVKRKLIWAAVCVVVILMGALGGGVLWYHAQLAPVGTSTAQLIKVTIAPGETPTQISHMLQDKKIIHSATAFDIYTRLSGTRSKLQAGTYRLSPAETLAEIVNHLVNGTVDQFSVTFLPGATLAQNRQVLLDAGFSVSDVDAALGASYDLPLFATKPASSDLEGYIYGETYNFNSGVTAQDILQRTFSQYEQVIQDNDLVSRFNEHGLTLYQGITLASIIQREVNNPTDQKQVAQVFYKRLAVDMPLGSDVTFIYAATKLGVTASPSLDSPYNTRLYKGLPPGPISVPGLTALQAVANPASGDYLFFLSGDDGKTYFANTDAEHQANIANYCKIKCNQ